MASRRSLGRGTPQWRLSRGARASDPSLLLDLLAAFAAFSAVRKLRTAYTGYAYRMSRDSDSAQLDVGFVGSSVDTAAAAAFSAGTTGRLHTWYDQSGNNRHLLRVGTPYNIIYQSGALITDAGFPSIHFTGAASGINRADSSGFVGDVDITVVMASSVVTGAADVRVGGFTNGQSFRVTNGNDLRASPGASAAYRTWVTTGLTRPLPVIVTRAAGTNASAWLAYSRGALLSPTGADNTTVTPSITNTSTHVGLSSAGAPFKQNFLALLPYIPTAGQRTIVDTELALHAP